MSDRRDQPDDPMESELRSWFRSRQTPAAPSTLRAFADRVGSPSKPTAPVRRLALGWRQAPGGRLAAAATAIAIVVLAGGLLLVAGQRGPAAPTSSPVTSQPAVTSSQPTGPAPVASPIDDGGIFGSSGLWAVAGDRLYLSSDFGATWSEHSLLPGVVLDATSGDVLSSVFVLDATNIWMASPGPGSNNGGMGPGFDHLYVVVSRTTDGGATWQSVTVPGDWGGRQPVLEFADRQHGYLLMAGTRLGGPSVVFATADGGATWQRSGGADMLGSIFSASDPLTVWSGNQGDAGPVARPILDVSRDAGRTWTDARLPGLVGDIFVNDNPVGPPVFSGQDGAVAVIAASTDTSPMVRFYRSSDGGRTWALAAQLHIGESGSTAVAVADPTHYVVIDARTGQLQATSDGGATWQPAPSTGLGASLRVRFWDPLNGAAVVQTSNGPAPAAGLIRTSDGGQTWSPVVIAAPSSNSPSSPTPIPTFQIPTQPPAQETSSWTKVNMPAVVTPPITVGGPGGGPSALPGGGFIDFVPVTADRTVVLTSPDGSTWTQVGEITGQDALGVTGPVAFNGHVYVALGGEEGGGFYGMQSNGAAWVSTDLAHWTKAPAQEGLGGAIFRGIAAGSTNFVAIGDSEGGGPTVWTSTDGLRWGPVLMKTVFPSELSEATGISTTPAGILIVGRIGEDAATWASPDGQTWTFHSPLPSGSGFFNGLAKGPAGFVSLVGAPSGAIEVAPGDYRALVTPWTSADGITWQPGSPSPALFGAYAEIAGVPGGYLAAGTIGLDPTEHLWSSADGTTWVPVAGVDLGSDSTVTLVSDGHHVLLWISGPSGLEVLVSDGVRG